jgi:hypothetical protein
MSRALWVVLVLLATGCSSAKVGQAGQTAWLWHSPKGGEFVVNGCPTTITSEECSKLPRVELTTNPQDQEAWQFERRSKVRALIGISYGRQPVDVIVVGSRHPRRQQRGRGSERQRPRRRIEFHR